MPRRRRSGPEEFSAVSESVTTPAYILAVRAIAIGAAIFLVTVGAAAGSGALTSQKALKAPRPSGVPQEKAGVVEQVACASANSCAAFGLWLDTEQGGKWKAATVPVLPHTGGANLRSLACPAAGRCEVVGMAGAQHLVAVTEQGPQWRSTGFALPGNAATIKPPEGPYPFASGLSCSAAGACTVVGHYEAADHTTHALLIAEHEGTWGTVTDVPLPPDASTKFPPPDSESMAGGLLNLASCASAGSCTTVGSYTRKPLEATYPWELDKAGGTWTGAHGLQLPAGAATTVDYRGGGASPFLGFSGLSCPGAGNCTAVGGYVDKHGDFQGGIFTERSGHWSNAIQAPVPAGAGPNTDPMQLNNPMTAVSCAAPVDCAAVGFYVTRRSETQHGLLLAEHQGKWNASALLLPRGAHTPGGVFLTSVSCPSPGNCVAVGYYGDHGKTHGLVVRERDGKWQRAVNAALPKGAAPAPRSHTFLTSVTCPSARLCLAGGYYAQRTGATQGLLLSLRLR
jgi:hypothetical protein